MQTILFFYEYSLNLMSISRSPCVYKDGGGIGGGMGGGMGGGIGVNCNILGLVNK